MLVGQMLVPFFKQYHLKEALQRNTKALCTSTGLPLSATAIRAQQHFKNHELHGLVKFTELQVCAYRNIYSLTYLLGESRMEFRDYATLPVFSISKIT